MTRRSAIVSLLTMIVSSVQAKEAKDSVSFYTLPIKPSPLWYEFDLKGIAGLRVRHGDQYVEITGEEIWHALRAED